VVETRPHEHHEIHDDTQHEGSEHRRLQQTTKAQLWVETNVPDELTPRVDVAVGLRQIVEDDARVFGEIELPEELTGAQSTIPPDTDPGISRVVRGAIVAAF
jgi:hypothetical protein